MKVKPLHFTQAYGLTIKESDLDFFDCNLIYDSLLFLDPFLIKNSTETDENRLYERFTRYFKTAYKKSINVKNNQASSRDLFRFLKFPEPTEINLGYTKKSNKGSGLGGDFAKALYGFFMSETAIRVLGKKELQEEINPEFFTLFTDKFAQDGISDLTANLIMDYLVSYTQKQCEILGVPLKRLKVNQTFDYEMNDWTYGCHYYLPENPIRPEEPIVLVPKRLLRSSKLTKQNIKSKVKGILNEDPILKERFARILVKPLDEITIDEIREIILSDDNVLKQFISYIESQETKPYDFIKDPLEFLSFKKFSELFKDLIYPEDPTNCEDLLKHTRKLIELFRNEYELKDSWRDAWYRDNKGGLKPIKEVAWGRAFRAAGNIYFDRFPAITFDSQVESGRGQLDFRIVFKECRIAIEIKFLKNTSSTGDPPLPAYIHGIERQLPGYSINLKATYAIYLTGQHYREFTGRKKKNHDYRVNEIRAKIPNALRTIQAKNANFKEIFYENIDLTPKKSFSKV